MIQSGLICALVWILMQGTDRLLAVSYTHLALISRVAKVWRKAWIVTGFIPRDFCIR